MREKQWVLIFIGLFYWLAHSLTRPLIAVHAQNIGLQEIEIGLIIAIYAILPFFLAIPSSKYVQRFGEVRTLRWSAYCMLLSGVCYSFSQGIVVLLLAQMFAGLGQMGVWMIIQVMVMNPTVRTVEFVANFTFYNTVGQLLGPLAGGVITQYVSLQMSFYVYTVISLFVLWLTFKIIEIKGPITIAHVEMKVSLKESLQLFENKQFVLMLLFSFMTLFILEARTTYLPIYLQTIQFSPMEIGVLLTIGAAASLLVRPIYKRLYQIFDALTISVGSFIGAICLLFFTPQLNSGITLGMLLFISGIALGINQPLSLSIIGNEILSKGHTYAVGLRLMANRLAQLVGPIIFSVFIATASLNRAFIYCACLLSLICL
ncbi:MAG: MFS transporter, partial [Lysinibacillus sp.]